MAYGLKASSCDPLIDIETTTVSLFITGILMGNMCYLFPNVVFMAEITYIITS